MAKNASGTLERAGLRTFKRFARGVWVRLSGSSGAGSRTHLRNDACVANARRDAALSPSTVALDGKLAAGWNLVRVFTTVLQVLWRNERNESSHSIEIDVLDVRRVELARGDCRTMS